MSPLKPAQSKKPALEWSEIREVELNNADVAKEIEKYFNSVVITTMTRSCQIPNISGNTHNLRIRMYFSIKERKLE